MTPLIIIGAGRSGTNALRDALSTLPEMSTWPCDEINYVWRSGNRDHPTDELLPEHARSNVRSFIAEQFASQASKNPNSQLIEKTCANSLRVGFVNAVFPDARFVHIQRDGRDVVSSAMVRWTAPLDIPYLASKVRFVPRRDLPHYAIRYLRSRMARNDSSDGRLSTWGPRFEGIDDLSQSSPLDVVCAEQWAACVSSARTQLGELPAERVLDVSYADLVDDPSKAIQSILDFCNRSTSSASVLEAAATIHGGSVGAWAERLDPEAIERIEPIVRRVQVDRLP